MNFVVLRAQRQTKCRMQNYLKVLPMLVYRDTNIGMVSEFFDFERLVNLIRNIDCEVELHSKDHNVPYHWSFINKVPSEKGPVRKFVLKLYPEQDGNLWEVHLLDLEFITRNFRTTDVELISVPNVVVQFEVSLERDKLTETQADGRYVRVPYVSNGCAYMLRKMLQYQSQNLAPNVIMRMEEYCSRFPRFIQRRLARYSGMDSLITVLSQLPGRKILFVTPPHDDDAVVLPDCGRVQGLVWVAPWAHHLIRGTHREVDCSFKALHPYTYYIPMAVLGNTGLPCGLSVWPTEASEIYHHFEQALGLDLKVPVLSDMGAAIKKFCADRGLEQFFCHRHIIEAIGANSIAGHLVQHMLEHLTIEDVETHMPQFVSDITVFYNAGQISQEQLAKVERYLGLHFHRYEDGSLTGQIDDPNAAVRATWAIGARGGVCRCSNHCECFHMHLNSKQRVNTSIATKLRSVVRLILLNYARFNKRICKMLRDKIRSLQVQYSGHEESCTCKEYRRNKMMYQSQGFCRHTCGSVSGHIEVTPELFVTKETNTISTTSIEIVPLTDILPVRSTHASSVPAAVATSPDEESSYWAPIPGLIRSLAFLLDCGCDEAGSRLMSWCDQNSISYGQLTQMNTEEISNLKYRITASQRSGE